MPDLWMDVDTALAEVPVNIFPLIDDTDFKSIEGAVAYNATGMALRWHFVTCAGAYTVTSVTPTTGGDYDWIDQGDSGVYTIEIPASGGASINNDTEGFGWFTGSATGILPWRGPVIGFRASGLNDKMVESAYDTTRGLAGTALPAAAAEAAGGLYTRGTGAGQINQDANGRVDTNVAAISTDTTAADNCEAAFDGTGYAGGTVKQKVDLDTIKTQAVTCAGGVTVPAATLASTTNVTAASGVTLAATQTGVTIPTVTTLTNAPSDSSGVTTLLTRIVGTLLAGNHTAQSGDGYGILNNGTYGNSALNSDLDTLLTRIVGTLASGTHNAQSGDAYSRLGAAGAGLTAVPWNASWDAEVQSECSDALTAAGTSTLTAAQVWDALLTGITTTGSVGKLIKDYLDAAITSRLASASYTAPPTVAQIQAEMEENGASLLDTIRDEVQSGTYGFSALKTLIDTLSGYVDTEVGAIKAKTDNLPASPAATGDIPSAGSLADAVWDELLSGHTGAGSAGLALSTASSGGVDPSVLADAIWDEALSGHATAGTTGKKLTDLANANLSGLALDSTVAKEATLATIAGYLDTEVAAILADTNELQTDLTNGGRLDLLVDAIKAKTDIIPASPASVGSAMTLEDNAITAAKIATGAIDADALAADAVDEILDEVIEGTLTMRQVLRILLAALAGKTTGGNTTTPKFRDVADSKNRISATVDADNNRTTITLDGS